MMHRFRVTLEVKTQSAFHTLGAGRTLPMVDRAIQVDAEGYPYIPGSTVRGRLRAHLERLQQTLGQPVCRPPRPDRTCPHYQPIQGLLADRGEPFCLVCRIFGSAWRESAIGFTDFHLASKPSTPDASVDERTSVGVSRRLGSAQAERLFVSQATVPGGHLRFVGGAEGRLADEEMGWLLAAINLVTHLGGDKARGLGWIRLNVVGLARWDHQTLNWVPVDAAALLKEAVDRAAI